MLTPRRPSRVCSWQVLAYLPPIAHLCKERSHSCFCRALGFCAFCELEGVINSIHSSTERAISPIKIVQSMRLIAKHFRPGIQQDAHEFLIFLVEKLQAASLSTSTASEVEIARSAHTTAISQLFVGRICSTVRCLRAGHTSESWETFTCLPVNIYKVQCVRTALRRFSSPEFIRNEDRYLCQECMELGDASKHLSVGVIPHVLVLQLNRFKHTRCVSDFHPVRDRSRYPCTSLMIAPLGVIVGKVVWRNSHTRLTLMSPSIFPIMACHGIRRR